MFQPKQDDVRRFFCGTYRKWHARSLDMTPLEAMAADWIALHPEYHADLADEEAALAAVYSAELGQANPFLHLSMHLTISEQLSIDQPRGIKQAHELLAAKQRDAHEAQHLIMECLGDMVWQAQSSGKPPDGKAYIECVQKKALK